MINLLAMAIMARFAPFIAFSLLYLNFIDGSLVIKIQLDSTKQVLTRLFPQRVILPCRTYCPVENSDGVKPI